MYETALNIIKKINELGYESYIVGGFARDKYLGRKTLDIDLCSNIKEDKLISNFDIIVKSNFGNFIIEENNYRYELTLFRKEIYQQSRYPQVKYVSTLKEDLNRRDFTINTLCIDGDGNYIDILNARDDIDNRIIRVVGNIKQKMIEDPLRIIRAVRFAADLDFSLETSLFNFIKNNNELIKNITKSRLLKEQKKVQNKEKFNSLIKQLDLEEYIQ